MIYLFCFAPIIIILIYSFYLLLKPANAEDRFFHLSRKLKKEVIHERIKLLEQIHNEDYRSDIIEIDKFYRDGRITEAEGNKIEKIITNTYFNYFKGRWSAFRLAELPMKIIFILCLVYGFIYVNLVFIELHEKWRQPDLTLQITLLIVNCTLLLPYLFSLTLLGFMTTFLSMLNLKFNERGGINRAAITSEELVKALKPGGRKTKVVLGSAWSRPIMWP
jgi:hypothetical protein